MTIGSTTLGSIIREALEDATWDLGVSLPAKVVSYDRATQTAVVEPGLRRPVRSAEDDNLLEYEDRPVMHGVPVAWPSGGPSYFHAELEAGDFVLVVCSDADFSAWRATGRVSSPTDGRTHHYSSAFAIPCVRPKSESLPGSTVVLAAGGASGQVVTVTALEFFLRAFVTAVSAAPAPLLGSAVGAAVTSALSTMTAPFPNGFGSAYISTGDALVPLPPTP